MQAEKPRSYFLQKVVDFPLSFVLLTFLGTAPLVWALNHFILNTTGISILWPINGFLLGIMLLNTRPGVWGYSLGHAFGNLVGYSLEVGLNEALLMTIAHSIELNMAFLLLRRVVFENGRNLGHPRVLWRFTIWAVLVSPAVAALITGYFLSEYFLGLSPWHTSFLWWASGALGMAIFAPMAGLFNVVRFKVWSGENSVGSALLRLFVLVLVSSSVFFESNYSLFFVVFPAVTWVVFKMGFMASPIVSLVLFLIAFPAAFFGYGPFNILTGEIFHDRFLLLQLFMGTVLLVTMPIGMVLDHRTKLIRKLKSREEELKILSRQDPLTKLLNRRGFEQEMGDVIDFAQKNNSPVSLIILDIDFFKKYNDFYGHLDGDKILSWLGSVLKEKSRAVDGFAVRQGGEEFGVLLPGMTLREAGLWAEILRISIEDGKKEHVGSAFGYVTVSVGVACRTGFGRNNDEKTLWQEADKALYEAKEGGRNKVVVSSVNKRLP